MVKYFGKHGLKQFIRGTNAPCLNIDEHLYGKATTPLVSMLSELPESKKKFPYEFHVDNLFTCPNLLLDMRNFGIWCSGTILDNRLPKGIPLPDKRCLKKKPKR